MSQRGRGRRSGNFVARGPNSNPVDDAGFVWRAPSVQNAAPAPAGDWREPTSSPNLHQNPPVRNEQRGRGCLFRGRGPVFRRGAPPGPPRPTHDGFPSGLLGHAGTRPRAPNPNHLRGSGLNRSASDDAGFVWQQPQPPPSFGRSASFASRPSDFNQPGNGRPASNPNVRSRGRGRRSWGAKRNANVNSGTDQDARLTQGRANVAEPEHGLLIGRLRFEDDSAAGTPANIRSNVTFTEESLWSPRMAAATSMRQPAPQNRVRFGVPADGEPEARPRVAPAKKPQAPAKPPPAKPKPVKHSLGWNSCDPSAFMRDDSPASEATPSSSSETWDDSDSDENSNWKGRARRAARRRESERTSSTSGSSDDASEASGRRRRNRREPCTKKNPGRKQSEVDIGKELEVLLNALIAESLRANLKTLSKTTLLSADRIIEICKQRRNMLTILNDSEIQLEPNIRICDDHVAEGCPLTSGECGLHVCSDWIVSNDCTRGADCDLGHDLTTLSNKKALERAVLQDFGSNFVVKILRAVLGRTGGILELCAPYFSSNGNCSQPCAKLHLCPGLILEGDLSCDGDDGNCRLNHEWRDPVCLKIYGGAGISVQVPMAQLIAVVRHRLARDELLAKIESFKFRCTDDEDGDVEKVEVCCEFLRGGCPRNLCHKLHAVAKPYHWQVRNASGGGPVWLNLPQLLSDELDEAFGHLDDQDGDVCLTPIGRVSADDAGGAGSLPGFDTVVKLLGPNSEWKADFSNMRLYSAGVSPLDVRRLSTPSAADSQDPLATRYVWYFKDDHGWVEYGKNPENPEDTTTSVTSVDSAGLEAKFCAGTKKYQFRGGRFAFEMDFANMQQVSLASRRARAVTRRPYKPPRPDAVRIMKTPPHWDKMGKHELLKSVDVKPGSPEFQKVQQIFTSLGGIPGNGISRLVRIQNIVLWNRYEARKDAMMAERNNNASLVNEQYLFHGTKPQSVDPIMRQGFTWKLAGAANGTAYGQGVYFGTTAQVSYGYSQTCMFLAHVLVGRSVQGHSGIVKPQPPYDTTSGPSMFIVYDEAAMYPEYIVYF